MAFPHTIDAEWLALRDALDNGQIEEMVRLGIPDDLIAHGVAVGIARVSFDAWGTYQPDEFGERAIIVAVRRAGLDLESPDPIGATLFGDLADLAAVAIEPPHRAAMRLGVVGVLGNVPPQLMTPEIVNIRTPLEWLREHVDGAAVGDLAGAAAELLAIQNHRFADPVLAHAVNDALLERLHLPRIVVAEPEPAQ